MTTSIITNRKRKLPQMNASHFEAAKQRRQKFSSFSQNFRHWFRDSFRTFKTRWRRRDVPNLFLSGRKPNKICPLSCHVFSPLSWIVILVHYLGFCVHYILVTPYRVSNIISRISQLFFALPLLSEEPLWAFGHLPQICSLLQTGALTT